MQDKQDGAFGAASVRSGKVVVVGIPEDHAPLRCGGMALVRVFQGQVEICGFRPRLGVYYPVFSPKWTSVLTIQGVQPAASANTKTNGNADHLDASNALLQEEYQASFSDSSLKLLRLRWPQLFVGFEMEEELTADAKAKEIAAHFPIVVILRVLPASFGNLQCFFSPSERVVEPASGLLPGFRFLTPRTGGSKRTNAGESDSSSSSSLAGASHELKSSEQIVSELWCTESFRTLEITPSWRSVVEQVTSQIIAKTANSKVVVCGAKGVGKSTFCRFLINRLLQAFPVVAFLDTDLGQPELTLPGLVSLHLLTDPLLGPGVTHFHQPLRSFFCGKTNPGNDPCGYMASVQHLVQVYETKYACGAPNDKLTASRPIPLVINTDGWIKSMGHDLLCNLIQQTHPDHVVQLLGVTKSQQFDLPTSSASTATTPSQPAWKIHHLPPWMASSWPALSPGASVNAATSFAGKMQQPPRSSKEMRRYRFYFYFLSSQTVPTASLRELVASASGNHMEEEMAVQLSKMSTIEMPFQQADVAFAGGICSVAPSQLLAALNVSVVGLCVNPKRPALPSPPPPVPRSHSESTDQQGEEDQVAPTVQEETEEAHEEEENHQTSGPEPTCLKAPRILLQRSRGSDMLPCVGVALVRSIDAQRGVLKLVTPVDARLVARVNVLVLGHFQALGTVLVNGYHRFVQTPYVAQNVLTGDGTGASVMKSRNSIKRKRDDKKV